ncbi:MAG: type IV pilus modification PilV family protein, partial [Methylobacter sp.]
MNKQAGFSLLEILIAFTILAFSLSILLNIFSTGANTAVVAEEYTAAVQIAES